MKETDPIDANLKDFIKENYKVDIQEIDGKMKIIVF